jgi:hypothetical protein
VFASATKTKIEGNPRHAAVRVAASGEKSRIITQRKKAYSVTQQSKFVSVRRYARTNYRGSRLARGENEAFSRAARKTGSRVRGRVEKSGLAGTGFGGLQVIVYGCERDDLSRWLPGHDSAKRNRAATRRAQPHYRVTDARTRSQIHALPRAAPYRRKNSRTHSGLCH